MNEIPIIQMLIKKADEKTKRLFRLGIYPVFIWWLARGYGIAGTGTPATYTYIFGLPMWFFLSSVVGYVLFCVLTVIVVKCFFRDFDLGEEAGQSANERSGQ